MEKDITLEEFLGGKDKMNAKFIMDSLRAAAKEISGRKKGILTDIQKSHDDNDRENKLDKPLRHAQRRSELNSLMKQRSSEIDDMWHSQSNEIQSTYSKYLHNWATLDFEKARDSIFSLGLDLTAHDLNKVLESSNGDYTAQRLALDYAKKHDIHLDTNITVDLEKKIEALKKLADSCGETISQINGSEIDEILEMDLDADWTEIYEIIALDQ